jgi:hypothetical protein
LRDGVAAFGSVGRRNDAELYQQEGVWKVEGDPTEGALYPFATKLRMDPQG